MTFKSCGCGGYARLATGYIPLCATRIPSAQHIPPNDVELPHRGVGTGATDGCGYGSRRYAAMDDI
ncbi:MAG: hypothetical protein K2J94_09725 [Duncaniella sp.]|nr:hypothetical protein [Duncaniella sp.]